MVKFFFFSAPTNSEQWGLVPDAPSPEPPCVGWEMRGQPSVESGCNPNDGDFLWHKEKLGLQQLVTTLLCLHKK